MTEATYRLLDILVGLSGREMRESREWRRVRKHLAAVNKVVRVVAELTHRSKDELEAVLQLSLVG